MARVRLKLLSVGVAHVGRSNGVMRSGPERTLPPRWGQETRTVVWTDGLVQVIIVRRRHTDTRERLMLEHKAERGRRFGKRHHRQRPRMQQIRRDGQLISPILIDALSCLS